MILNLNLTKHFHGESDLSSTVLCRSHAYLTAKLMTYLFADQEPKMSIIVDSIYTLALVICFEQFADCLLGHTNPLILDFDFDKILGIGLNDRQKHSDDS